MSASSERKVPSLSSASTTNHSPSSQTALVPISLTSPPMRNEGVLPPSTSCRASIDAVVVLPWVPATAMHRLSDGDGGQGLGPGQHGDPATPGLDRSRGCPRAMAEDAVTTSAAADVGGGVADGHRHPGAGQPLGDRRRLEVAAGHRVTHGVQHGGDGAHARAADPHHVHGRRASARIAERPGGATVAHRRPAGRRPGVGLHHPGAGGGGVRPAQRGGGPLHGRESGRVAEQPVETPGQRPRRRSRRRGAGPTPRPARAPGRWPSGGRPAHRAGAPGPTAPRPRPARPRSSPPPGTPPGRRRRRPGPSAPRREPAPARGPVLLAVAGRLRSRRSSAALLPVPPSDDVVDRQVVPAPSSGRPARPPPR